MPVLPPIDFSALTPTEFEARLGELIKAALLRDGMCVIVAKGTHELTLVNPLILDAVPDEDFAEALLSSWTDEEILTLLEGRRPRRASQREPR